MTRYIHRSAPVLLLLTLMARAVAAQDLTISSDLALSESVYTFNNLTVNNGATLTIGGGSTLTINNSLMVTGNSTILLQGKNTAGLVGGQFQGVGVTINAANVQVDMGSTISADGQGYAGGQGPGAGHWDAMNDSAGGGGYGGAGATHQGNAGGAAYGSPLAPTDLGSGGGNAQTAGGAGGGAIRLNVTGTLALGGAIRSNGQAGIGGGCITHAGGGGAGGSLYVTATVLTGAGSFNANGGAGGSDGCNGNAGAGGGGRIAIFYADGSGFSGFVASAANGGGGQYPAPPGTEVFVNTANNGLRVLETQTLRFEPATTLSFGSVTVDNAATLTLGGVSTLDTSGNVLITGNSTLVLQGTNTTGQVDGQWQGVGVTINAANVQVLYKAYWNMALLNNDNTFGIHNPAFFQQVVGATTARLQALP